MDVSWLQDKNQLMRKDGELDRLSKSLLESQEVVFMNREHNEKFTNMVECLECDVSRVCAVVEDACVAADLGLALRERLVRVEAEPPVVMPFRREEGNQIAHVQGRPETHFCNFRCNFASLSCMRYGSIEVSRCC